MTARFADRRAAGHELAERLARFGDRKDVVVLGLPRGGMPVAYQVARALRAPLDVLVVRKLGVPGHEELAAGAIASGGVRALNDDVVRATGLEDAEIDAIARREGEELERRERLYRGDREPVEVAGRTAIVVDDGLATGATMRAAVLALRRRDAASIVVAVPTGSPQTCEEIGRCADEIVCVQTPEPFVAVGLWYRHFAPTTDHEVRELLESASQTTLIPPS